MAPRLALDLGDGDSDLHQGDRTADGTMVQSGRAVSRGNRFNWWRAELIALML